MNQFEKADVKRERENKVLYGFQSQQHFEDAGTATSCDSSAGFSYSNFSGVFFV